MTVSLEQFVRYLAENGLMSPEEVRKFFAPGPRSEAGASDLPRMLTDFQPEELGSGDSRKLVFGNYLVLEKIGHGGMGIVFKAKHRRMNRIVALKVLAPWLSHDQSAVRRFQREVETAARLHHPNIASAYDADEDHGILYFVMEFIEGRDLASRVREEGPMPVLEAVTCIAQAARGLAYAHQQGIVHRDIKPANLLLDRTGITKILDVGLARLQPAAPFDSDLQTESATTARSTLMGTVDYMAPEQAIDVTQATFRSDIYSLGCTLHFLLTGRPVYQGESVVRKVVAHREEPVPSLAKLRNDIPPELDAIFARMLAKDPGGRYASAGEVADALDEVIQRLTTSCRDSDDFILTYDGEPHATAGKACFEATTVAFMEPRAKRRRRRSIVTAAVLLLGLSAAGAALLIPKREQVPAEVEPIVLIDDGEPMKVRTVAFSPDGRQALSAGHRNTSVLVWDLNERAVARRLIGHESWVSSAVWSPDGRYALSGGGGSWQLVDGHREGGDDFRLRLWDVASGAELQRFEGHTQPVASVAFAPDGHTVASAGYDGTVRLWSAESGEEVGQLSTAGGEVLSVRFSPDGNRLLVGQWHFASLWAAADAELIREFKGHTGPVLTAVFSPNGTQILTGDQQGTIRLWDAETGQMLKQLKDHRDNVAAIAFCPGGARFLSGGEDGLIRLWDIPSGRIVSRFEGHQGAVKAIDVSPDGKNALSGSEDGAVRLWAIEPAGPSAADPRQ